MTTKYENLRTNILYACYVMPLQIHISLDNYCTVIIVCECVIYTSFFILYTNFKFIKHIYVICERILYTYIIYLYNIITIYNLE